MNISLRAPARTDRRASSRVASCKHAALPSDAAPRNIARRALPGRTRRGLAPLELVLSLPILLFVMALMVNFGTLACWKARGAVVARQSVWRERWPMRGSSDPRPASWPAPATLTTVSSGSILQNDPFAAHPVVRGPVVSDQSTGRSIPVNQQRLDFNLNLRQGQSATEVQLPLLPGLGPISYSLRHELLEGSWAMGGAFRRIPLLYDVDFNGQLPSLRQAFVDAAVAILTAPFASALRPLDKDDEFQAYYGPPPPDFHAHLMASCRNASTCCDMNIDSVRANLLDPDGSGLIDRIEGPRSGGRGGIPERMADRFINLYESQKQTLESQLQQPGLGQAQLTQLQQQISSLDTKIQQLQEFRSSLN